jgi:perosamine synthetase
MIPMLSSYISPLATKYVSDVLNSGMLSEGEVVKKFEEKFEETFGLRKNSFVAVNSGTSALHLAIETLGVKGKILLPANTFIATGLAILYAGCTPVFCDILPDGTIDPEDVVRKITPDTVSIIGVNWAGKKCGYSALEAICFAATIPLIIDAAQSLGMDVGGDITCFSFQATKHLTTGDGGGLWCRDSYDYMAAKELRWFGISKDTKTGLLGERDYDLDRLGFKYHMNDFSASLGLANLWNIKDRLSLYKTLASVYEKNLKSLVAIPIHKENSAFWAYPVRVDDVVRFTKFCRDKKVPCSIIHRGIDQNKIFGGIDYRLSNQRVWEATVTHLPIHTDMANGDVEWICSEVNKYV